MSLLREIQAALIDEKPLGPILLKLRLLASRLGSDVLEEWVKHESEGYPTGVVLPDYREVAVSYLGTFSGAFGSGIKNAPIPSYLIEKFAGKKWSNYEIRHSVSLIDDLVGSVKNSGTIDINAANLILLLQGHIYEDYACNSITGRLSRASFVEIQNAVRTRALELTIQIEKTVPAAGEITLGPVKTAPGPRETEAVTQITNQVIHGNYTSVSNTGHGARFSLNISNSDAASVVRALEEAGIAAGDAQEISKIFASETPDSKEEPFGENAKAWIAKNIGKAIDGTWKVGVSVATKVLTEAALRYYGLK
jgi:hypothetical protein